MRTLKPALLRLGCLLLLPLLAYSLWSPGVESTDGKFDRALNGLWLAHGWMADDGWFARNHRPKDAYDTEAARSRLKATCAENGIAYVFPHLCPATPAGRLPAHDSARIERLLDTLPAAKVLPWVGGVHGEHCPVESSSWRAAFVASCADLLRRHPRLAGLHLNIEPMPDGNPHFLSLLDELKATFGPGKILSVAAYPPPTRWHPHPEVHWSEAYYREVDRRCDQLVPMMYDTALRFEKIYIHLLKAWTTEVSAWTSHGELLLGVPAYEDAGAGYHDPRVENLDNALRGVNAALLYLGSRANRVSGVALYADWTTDAQEWALFRNRFRPDREAQSPDARPTSSAKPVKP